MNITYLIGSIIIVGLIPSIGALFLFLKEESLDKILLYLVSLSTGAIFGGTFIHLIPKYANNVGYTHFTGLIVLLGITGSHVLEKMVHWHCHSADHDIEPFSYMILFGDSLHNIIDGLLIASSYLISISAGLAATVMVMLHKIPKEVGDFGTMVHGGFTKEKALLFNIGVGGFMFLGAGLVLLLSGFQTAEEFLIPLTIGNFVYIAGTDLFPEIKQPEGDQSDILLTLVFLLGIALMYSIVWIKPYLP